jgi:hypothetical protein
MEVLKCDIICQPELTLHANYVLGWKPVAVIRHHDMLDFHTQPVSGWMELTSASTSEVIEDRPVVVGKQVKTLLRLRRVHK